MKMLDKYNENNSLRLAFLVDLKRNIVEKRDRDGLMYKDIAKTFDINPVQLSVFLNTPNRSFSEDRLIEIIEWLES